MSIPLLALRAQRIARIAAWATSPQPVDPNPSEPLLKIGNQTVRESVRVSVGGDQIRILLSNEYGSAPSHWFGNRGSAEGLLECQIGLDPNLCYGSKGTLVLSWRPDGRREVRRALSCYSGASPAGFEIRV
jgi:hypothetical protein